MKSTIRNTQVPKRPFNLTLSEHNVAQARNFTTNLSATVDVLLAEYVQRESFVRQEKRQLYAKVAEAWNDFGSIHGSFTDEHSTL